MHISLTSTDTVASFCAWALIIMSAAGFVLSLLKNRESSKIEDKVIPLLNISSTDKNKIQKKQFFLSISTVLAFGITFSLGIVSLVANNKIQEDLKNRIGEVQNDASEAKNTAIESKNYAQEALNKTDFLSEQIKNLSPANKGNRQLTPSQMEAFKSLNMLNGKDVCLVSVSGDSEEQKFFQQIQGSLSAYKARWANVSIGHMTSAIYNGSTTLVDEHNGIQIFDPDGKKGSLYQAFKIAGLSPVLIDILPVPCQHVMNLTSNTGYAIIIGKN